MIETQSTLWQAAAFDISELQKNLLLIRSAHRRLTQFEPVPLVVAEND
ncbi:MAG: hypothetical protein NTW75_16060 [Planctomycetales bacterium]|jgi:hypothetical protein|nr:hypothetical protein [Planctomycetales bacterium]